MVRRMALIAVVLLALASPLFAGTDALSLIPNDAVTVGVVRIADLRTSALAATLFQQTDKISTDGDAEKFLREAGLKPSKDVDLLVVATSPRTNLGSEPEVLVAAEGRFNVDALTKALVARGAVKKNGYLMLPKDSGEQDTHTGVVAFPDGGLALIGSKEAVIEALAARSAGGTTFLTASGLGREVNRIDPKASAWAVVDVARAQRLTSAPHVPGRNQSGQALQAAIKSVSTVALWATDGGDSLKLGAFGIASDAETLQLLEDTIRGALAAMRLAVQDKAPEMVSVLRKFEVSRTNDTVQISGSIPAETLKNFTEKHRKQASVR